MGRSGGCVCLCESRGNLLDHQWLGFKSEGSQKLSGDGVMFGAGLED